MREGGVATATGCIGLARPRRFSCLERAADRRVALEVGRVDAFLPVGSEVGVRRQVRAGCCSITGHDLDVEVRRVVAELREPEALLVDEIEGEAVRPRWDRAANVQLSFDSLPGRCVYFV